MLPFKLRSFICIKMCAIQNEFLTKILGCNSKQVLLQFTFEEGKGKHFISLHVTSVLFIHFTKICL